MKRNKLFTLILCVVLCSCMMLTSCFEPAGSAETGGTDSTAANTSGEGTMAPVGSTSEETTEEGTTSAATTPAETEKPTPEPIESFKVLAIGNSFSEDALEHLYNVAKASGVKDICVANLYIGGCSLTMHYTNAKGNKEAYKFSYNNSGTWKSVSNQTMKYGIEYEEWDVIVLQQVSGDSGRAGTYEPALSYVINYVKENAKNPDVKLAWHMTWAYQANSTHSAFSNYSKNQMTMYTSIVNAVNSKVLPTDAFDYVIPSGTAIQNVRTSFIGDTLTRDGYHLGWSMGRYIASLTWFSTLSGMPIDDVSWRTSDVDDAEFAAIVEAVNNAIEKPYEVTQSTHTAK